MISHPSTVVFRVMLNGTEGKAVELLLKEQAGYSMIRADEQVVNIILLIDN